MVDLNINLYDGVAVAEDFGSGAIYEYESIATAEWVSLSRQEDFSNFLRGYPFVEITHTHINITTLGGGYEQILDLWGDYKMGFQITFPVSKKEDATPIREFYQRNYGKIAYFTSPIDSVTYNVRIVNDSYSLQRTAYDTYFASIALIEVF